MVKVAEGGEGRMEEHARAGVAHYTADGFTVARFIAMDAAFAATCLLFAEGATLQLFPCVQIDVVALRAVLDTGFPVLRPAINANHLRDCFLFPLYSVH